MQNRELRIRVPAAMAADLERVARMRGATMAGVIRSALYDYLSSYKAPASMPYARYEDDDDDDDDVLVGPDGEPLNVGS